MTPKYLTNLPDPKDLGNGQWAVPSRTVVGKRYVVTHRTGGWQCTCLGFKFSHWCNHCRRLKVYLEAQPPVPNPEQEAEQVVREFLV